MRADEARSLSRAPRACVAVHACLVGSEPVWLGGRLLGCWVFALPGTRPAVACCRACSTAAARAREGAGEGLTPISSTLPPPRFVPLSGRVCTGHISVTRHRTAPNISPLPVPCRRACSSLPTHARESSSRGTSLKHWRSACRCTCRPVGRGELPAWGGCRFGCTRCRRPPSTHLWRTYTCRKAYTCHTTCIVHHTAYTYRTPSHGIEHARAPTTARRCECAAWPHTTTSTIPIRRTMIVWCRARRLRPPTGETDLTDPTTRPWPHPRARSPCPCRPSVP